MSRSTLMAAALILAMTSLAACQVTDNLFGSSDDAGTETDVETVEATTTEPAPLPPYQPPAYQQPIYQQPGGPGVPPYGQPVPQPGYPPTYQQPGYPPAPQPGYPPQQTGYPPQQPGYPMQPGYPPQQVGGPIGDPSMVARGEYLVTVSGCSGCHTDGALIGDPSANRYLAGTHIGINVDDLGIMYAPNITPDPLTGIGNWSIHDIVRALRDGVRPNGTAIRPPMPIAKLSQLTIDDASAIAAYLKTIPPVHHVTNRNPVAKSQVNYPYLDVVDVKMAE